MKLTIRSLGRFESGSGERFFWMGRIERDGVVLAEQVQMAGACVTRDEAIRNAQNFAAALNMDCEIPADPCL